MGAKHPKSPRDGSWGGSPQHSWRRTPSKERGGGGDLLALLRSGERLNRAGPPPPPPYQRRIGMIQEMMGMAKQGRHDQATEVLKSLRQVGSPPTHVRQTGCSSYSRQTDRLLLVRQTGCSSSPSQSDRQAAPRPPVSQTDRLLLVPQSVRQTGCSSPGVVITLRIHPQRDQR
ncbi:hypothetical protein NHX12_009226 [Muraenolepis orangiensis]|uniref:Uncharacterized protein n=1 Tax=Muraenolepis orangiensis TaxID=630683 RepID=A0A9Q0IAL3_9TELE|nr:hypothetical protein NHX12_009226 [Muraenolepis orangiensis]